jgi:hypothetical protein
VVLHGELGGAPGGGQGRPAAGAGGGEPRVGLGAQAEGALAERAADTEHPGLDQEVDQQGELLLGQVEVAGEPGEVTDGHGPGPHQAQRLAVQAGAHPFGGDHGPGGGGRRPLCGVGDGHGLRGP